MYDAAENNASEFGKQKEAGYIKRVKMGERDMFLRRIS